MKVELKCRVDPSDKVVVSDYSASTSIILTPYRLGDPGTNILVDRDVFLGAMGPFVDRLRGWEQKPEQPEVTPMYREICENPKIELRDPNFTSRFIHLSGGDPEYLSIVISAGFQEFATITVSISDLKRAIARIEEFNQEK